MAIVGNEIVSDWGNWKPEYLQTQDVGQGLDTGIGDGVDWGGWASGFGSVAKGVGGLAQAWQGMQGLKLAKKQLKTQNEQWTKNYDAQREDIAYDRSQRSRARARMES